MEGSQKPGWKRRRTPAPQKFVFLMNSHRHFGEENRKAARVYRLKFAIRSLLQPVAIEKGFDYGNMLLEFQIESL